MNLTGIDPSKPKGTTIKVFVAGIEIALDPFIALELVGPQAGHRVSCALEKSEEQVDLVENRV